MSLFDTPSSLFGAAAVVLGDSVGEALRVTTVATADPLDADAADSAIEITDHLGSFLGNLLPTISRALASAAGLERGENLATGDLSGSLRSLAGDEILRLVLPGGSERLDGLDPATAMLQSIGPGGSITALIPSISSAEMAGLARAGSGPMFVTLLAVEAGIEQILVKLRQIEGKIDEIMKGMERERTARMRGTIAYLSDITGTIRTGKLNAESVTSFSGELENTDREARGFSEIYRATLNERIEDFENLDIAGANLDIDDDVKAIRAEVTTIREAVGGLLLSMSVRMITMRVRSLLPVEQESTGQRIERLEREIDELLSGVTRSREIMRQKAEEIHGLRQEVVQKTGSLLGGAGKLVGKTITPKTIGGKLAMGIAGGAAGLVGSAVGKVGRVLEGAAVVEEVRRVLNENFDAFEEEIRAEIEGVREDGDIVENVREKHLTESSEIVLDLSVGEDGTVYVRG